MFMLLFVSVLIESAFKLLYNISLNVLLSLPGTKRQRCPLVNTRIQLPTVLTTYCTLPETVRTATASTASNKSF